MQERLIELNAIFRKYLYHEWKQCIRSTTWYDSLSMKNSGTSSTKIVKIGKVLVHYCYFPPWHMIHYHLYGIQLFSKLAYLDRIPKAFFSKYLSWRLDCHSYCALCCLVKMITYKHVSEACNDMTNKHKSVFQHRKG